MKHRFLGIDGGGTKTAAVLLDGEGSELARATGGPSNYHSVGRAVTERSLCDVIHQVLSSAGLAAADVRSIGLGMAGVGRPSDHAVVHDMLSRAANFPRIVITHDAEAALVGGIGRRYGVVLIAGTGAIAYGVNARGEARRADGWGYLVGDEGSARWIGVEGLRAIAQADDGRGPATELKERLLTYVGLQNASQLVTLVYADDFDAPRLAGLAPLVSQAAQAGDAVAQDILREAGRRLSHSVGAVIRGLKMKDAAFEAVLLGGVLRARYMVRETVVAELGQIAPRAHVVEPRHDAAVGAALLAMQAGE